MNFDQLRIFVAVAERGHMSRAAEGLGMSQSAASAAVKALETSCGVALFNRVGRNIELSQAGARFLPEAKAVIDRAAAARLVLDNISQEIGGSVSVSASQTIASYWLPKRLASFHDAYPAVRLHVSIGNTREVESAVLNGAADIGLVEGRTRSDLLKRIRVATDRLVLISARPIPPGPTDFASFRWIVREPGSGTREVLEDWLAQNGQTLDDLRVFLVFPSNEAVLRAVEAGAGVTVISRRAAHDAIQRGTVEVVPVASREREFVLIMHRDRHPLPAQLALKNHLKD